MALEFGVVVGILGTIIVFLALGVVVLTVEIFKKAFKGRALEMGKPLIGELELPDEATLEMAAMAAAIHTHESLKETQHISRIPESIVQPDIWITAGRIDQLSSF